MADQHLVDLPAAAAWIVPSLLCAVILGVERGALPVCEGS